MALGWPNVFGFSFQAWAYLIIAFIAAVYGVEYLAAHSVLINITAMEFEIGAGLSQACAVLVGQKIGSNDVKGAREVYRSSNTISFLLMILSVGILMATKTQIESAFIYDDLDRDDLEDEESMARTK